MEKRERRKAFVASLTEAQRSLYRVMREGVHQSRGAYHKSLSKDQKEKIKKRHKHNRGHRDMESIPPPPPPEHPDSIKRGGHRLN